MEFCDIVKALRLSNKLTQKDLGDKLSLHFSTVCDWERKRSEPNLNQLKKLSEIFSVTTDFLLGISNDC